MKKILRLCKHPFGIYVVFIVVFFAFCLIGIPLLSIGHSGGEQVPLTILGHGISGLVFGLILWSVVSPIMFWRWYKENMFIPLIVPVGTAALLIYMLIEIYLQNNHYLAI